MDLTLDGAADAREALSKALYANLFRWLVERVNLALASPAAATVVKLSILDIYGFECFEENAFEQLCINFANESLQQLFNRSTPLRTTDGLWDCRHGLMGSPNPCFCPGLQAASQ